MEETKTSPLKEKLATRSPKRKSEKRMKRAHRGQQVSSTIDILLIFGNASRRYSIFKSSFAPLRLNIKKAGVFLKCGLESHKKSHKFRGLNENMRALSYSFLKVGLHTPYRGVRYRTMHVLYTTLMRLTAINYQDLFVFSQDIAHEHS